VKKGSERITRRRFLRRTLLGAALLTVGGTTLRHLSGYSLDAATAGKLRALSPKEYLVLAAVCRRILAPDEKGAISCDEVGTALAVDAYLAAMPDYITSDVRALLHLLEHTPFLWSGRPSRFTHLDAAAQDAVLAGWESSRLDVRRRGFVALKSLAMIGYYGDPRAYAVLDYTGPMIAK
jgi:hypothetical protein